MSTLKFNQWLNPDNSENFKCRAWVNFNGTGAVAIRAAGNVSSITDNGAGQYLVNFTTPMADANYGAVLGYANNTNNADSANNLNTFTVNGFAWQHIEGAVFVDCAYMGVAVYR